MGKIIVTGTPGSGKSTILSKIKVKAKLILLSDEFLKYTTEKGIGDRDKIRYMSYSDISSIRREIIKRFNTMPGDILIDTHATVKRGTKYIPGFSTDDLGAFKDVKALIYIDAHASDIMLRRAMDKTR